MKPENVFDVVVVGGGVVGLWVLSALRSVGYNAVLFEKQALGAGQTLAAQGILHGGTKYALTGKLTGSSEAIRGMPERWQRHLLGQMQPDLHETSTSAQHQWMWGTASLASKVSSFFASKVMQSRVQPVEKSQLPFFLEGQQVYQLEEPVLDVRSLVESLCSKISDRCYCAAVTSVTADEHGVELALQVAGTTQTIQTRAVVFSAGAGNQWLQSYAMQKRPLHMVMVKGKLPSVWGHVIEANANPRLTITTHTTQQGESVWYLGGQLAESGSKREPRSQIEATRKELEQLFPQINWATMQWATLMVDRAEGAQAGGRRPDEPVIAQDNFCITAWPTKLVFTPLVADEVLKRIQQMALEKTRGARLPDIPLANVGEPPWESTAWST